MTQQMREEAEAARALVRLEVAVRVAVRNGDEAAVLANFTAYAKAGRYLALGEIEVQEKKAAQKGRKS